MVYFCLSRVFELLQQDVASVLLLWIECDYEKEELERWIPVKRMIVCQGLSVREVERER